MPSRALPAIFSGSQCPISMNYGFGHGPSPTGATIQYEEGTEFKIGDLISIQVAGSQWSGYVVRSVENDNELGKRVTITAVDWRDRLKDFNIYGAFNIREADGRYWHIIPEMWEIQRRIYVTKELEQQNFKNVQAPKKNNVDNNFLEAIGDKQLFSTWTILSFLANTYQFNWLADTYTAQVIKKVYPLNLDWNQGVNLDQAIDQLLKKSGMQFCIYGSSTLYITMRGYSDNTSLKEYASGVRSICDLGASSGTKGKEINDSGRRIAIVGDRNVYEDWYACNVGWNPAWTWEFTFGGWQLSAVLKANNLTLLSKVSDLPAAFHDATPLQTTEFEVGAGGDAKKTRNDLTIKEYRETFPFRVYQVNSQIVAASGENGQGEIIKTTQKDFSTGKLYALNRETLQRDNLVTKDLSDYDPSAFEDLGGNPLVAEDMGFFYEPDTRLVSETNAQFLYNATSRNIVWGANNPFAEQRTLVPMDAGASLEVVESLKVATKRVHYLIFIKFSNPQYYIDLTKNFLDPKSIEPDRVMVQLSLVREIYAKKFGEVGNNIRVREKRVPVSGLKKAYIMNQEPKNLALNFLKNLQNDGVQPAVQPVKTDDIAEAIASWHLMHLPVDISGSITFHDRAGTYPDGVIDSVSVNFSGTSLSETVQYSSAKFDLEVPFEIIEIDQSVKRKFEDDIARDRLDLIVRQANQGKGQAQQAQINIMQGQQHPGGLMAGSYVGVTAYGNNGMKKARMAPAVYQNNNIHSRQVVMANHPIVRQKGTEPEPIIGSEDADNPGLFNVRDSVSLSITHSSHSGKTGQEARRDIVSTIKSDEAGVMAIPVDNNRVTEVNGSGDIEGEISTEGVVWARCYYDGTNDTAPIVAGRAVAFDTKKAFGVTGINDNWGKDEYKVVGTALASYNNTAAEGGMIPIKLNTSPQDGGTGGYPAKVIGYLGITARNNTTAGSGQAQKLRLNGNKLELDPLGGVAVWNWTQVAFEENEYVWIEEDESGIPYVISKDCPVPAS